MEKPIDGEFNFFRHTGAWRFGAGVSYGSFAMKEPYQDEQEWGQLQIYGFGTRVFRMRSAVRPYIQLRAGTQRLHPRSELFATLPEDPENKGKSRTLPTNGFFVGVVPGLELKLSRAAYLDASFAWKYFSVDDYDLSPVGQPPAGSGTTWEARIGATWFPNGGQGAGDAASATRGASRRASAGRRARRSPSTTSPRSRPSTSAR